MSPIRRSVARVGAMPWTVLAGVALGLVLAPGGGVDWAYSLYDDLYPVVRMHGILVSNDRLNGAVLRISGDKLRPCVFLAVRPYAERDGLLVDVNTERVDRPSDGHTKPTGSYDIGLWRVWPVTGAQRVKMFVKHSCDGRLVVTKIADVELPRPALQQPTT